MAPKFKTLRPCRACNVNRQVELTCEGRSLTLPPFFSLSSPKGGEWRGEEADYLSSNSEVEFLRWRSAAVPAAAKWDELAVEKCSVA